LVENRQFEPTPLLFGATVENDAVGFSPKIRKIAEIFGISKLEYMGYRMALFA